MSIQDLYKKANYYDSLGKTKTADYIDDFIIRWAKEEEPTMEDLLEEEEFIKTLDEDPLEGLSQEDSDIASEYMETGKVPERQPSLTTEQLTKLLDDLEKEEQLSTDEDLIGYADSFAESAKETQDDLSLLPHEVRHPIEASFRNDLNKIAGNLDYKGYMKAADRIDSFIFKMAKDEDEKSDDKEEEDIDTEELDSDLEKMPVAEVLEVSTVSPDKLEFEEELADEDDKDSSSVDLLEDLLSFIAALSDGAFDDLESAQKEADKILDKHSKELDDIDYAESERESSEHSHSPFFMSVFNKDIAEA